MTESRAVATAQPARQVARVENIQPMFDTDRFEHFQRAASALMHSSILNPSIRGDDPKQCFSNLMLVFDLADRWKLPPLSIAQCISIVHNKVVYEGKLIQAALNSSLGVTLYPWWTGERGTLEYRIFLSDTPWDDMSDEQLAALRPGVQIRGRRIIDGSVGEWRTFKKNSTEATPAWSGAATQNQLLYRGSREWARRFEPAHLLGVYGDDEIEMIQSRMDRARDAAPAALGLSGGLTKPAAAEPAAPAAAEEVEDAQVEDVEVEDAQDAPEAAKETQGEAEAMPGPEKVEDAAQDGPSVEDVAVRARAAYEATFGGGAHSYEGEDEWPAEARIEIDKQAQIGADEFDDAKELAYHQGRAGQMMTEVQPPADAGAGLKHRWNLLRAEWRKGQDDAKEDAASDGESGPDAADEDVDGEVDAAAGWASTLIGLGSWAEIKPALHAFSQSDEWKAAAPEQLAEFRSLVWSRQHAIIQAGDEKFDFLNDLTAFRCWIEWTDDADAIEGNWQALASMDHFGGLAEAQQKAMAQAVAGRIKALGGGE